MIAAWVPLSARGASGRVNDTDDEQNYYANAHPYIEEPLKQLIETNSTAERPSAGPGSAAAAHNSAEGGRPGGRILPPHNRPDCPRRNLPDTAQAGEALHQTRTVRRARSRQLPILRHRNNGQTEIIEYRTDGKGDNFDQVVVQHGFLVTSGFALSCNYFSTGFQSESTFRYLGEEKIGEHDSYVVAFAQQPGKATLSIRMRGRSETSAHVLVQGVAWIDKSDFQIVHMRTDLLAPRKDIGLSQQTTEITFEQGTTHRHRNAPMAAQ